MEQLEHANNTELIAKLTGKPAAEALLKQYGGLTNLAQASFDELQMVKGIGQSKAAAVTDPANAGIRAEFQLPSDRMMQ